jgi:hypothetical protein
VHKRLGLMRAWCFPPKQPLNRHGTVVIDRAEEPQFNRFVVNSISAFKRIEMLLAGLPSRAILCHTTRLFVVSPQHTIAVTKAAQYVLWHVVMIHGTH